ncbi:MAG: cobalamin-binding protein [Gammaproteobacteria bacterium]|nr:cobalamin-binding protein [Gammaproteobacteria bacterium]
MFRRHSVFLHLSLFVLAVFFIANRSYAGISVVDDAGRTVTLAAPAQRIISLAPHVTELLYAAGAGERIVGVVSYSDYPAAAKKLPKVGSYNAFDLEAIVALQPDLVVAWQSANPAAALEKLQTLSVPVFFSEPRRLEDVATNLERLGKLTANEVIADTASATFRRRLAGLRSKYRSAREVSVFYQVWHQPLMTIGGEHIISQVIELCGGRNVFASLSILAPKISLEAVLRKDPEVVVAGNSALNHSGWKDDWRRWPALQAVENNHLFYVNPDIIQRHTPRILQGAEVLCEHLEAVRRKGEGLPE